MNPIWSKGPQWSPRLCFLTSTSCRWCALRVKDPREIYSVDVLLFCLLPVLLDTFLDTHSDRDGPSLLSLKTEIGTSVRRRRTCAPWSMAHLSLRTSSHPSTDCFSVRTWSVDWSPLLCSMLWCSTMWLRCLGTRIPTSPSDIWYSPSSTTLLVLRLFRHSSGFNWIPSKYGPFPLLRTSETSSWLTNLLSHCHRVLCDKCLTSPAFDASVTIGRASYNQKPTFADHILVWPSISTCFVSCDHFNRFSSCIVVFQ